MQWIIGFILAFVVSKALALPLIYGIGIVAGLWMMSGSGVGGGIFSGLAGLVTGTFGVIYRFVLFTFVFIGLMMLVNRFTGVSPEFVSAGFQVLGVYPLGWPAHIGYPILIFVCSVFLVGYVAKQAAQGHAKMAGTMFAIGFVVIFVAMNMERTAEAVRPKPEATMPATATKWDDTDQTVAERGAVPTGFCVAWQFAFGPRGLCGPKKAEANSEEMALAVANVATVAAVPANLTFPITGEGRATKEEGLKAYLDPTRTYTRPTKPARYVFAQDPDLFYDDLAGLKVNRDPERRKMWREMPAGNYIVYPLEAEEMFFRWYQ